MDCEEEMSPVLWNLIFTGHGMTATNTHFINGVIDMEELAIRGALKV